MQKLLLYIDSTYFCLYLLRKKSYLELKSINIYEENAPDIIVEIVKNYLFPSLAIVVDIQEFTSEAKSLPQHLSLKQALNLLYNQSLSKNTLFSHFMLTKGDIAKKIQWQFASYILPKEDTQQELSILLTKLSQSGANITFYPFLPQAIYVSIYKEIQQSSVYLIVRIMPSNVLISAFCDNLMVINRTISKDDFTSMEAEITTTIDYVSSEHDINFIRLAVLCDFNFHLQTMNFSYPHTIVYHRWSSANLADIVLYQVKKFCQFNQIKLFSSSFFARDAKQLSLNKLFIAGLYTLFCTTFCTLLFMFFQILQTAPTIQEISSKMITQGEQLEQINKTAIDVNLKNKLHAAVDLDRWRARRFEIMSFVMAVKNFMKHQHEISVTGYTWSCSKSCTLPNEGKLVIYATVTNSTGLYYEDMEHNLSALLGSMTTTLTQYKVVLFRHSGMHFQLSNMS